MTEAPIRISGLRGGVSLGIYGHGSKSEREAVFIDANDARYVLRSKNGPAFGDASMLQYVGKEVLCDGFLVGTTLLVEHIVALK